MVGLCAKGKFSHVHSHVPGHEPCFIYQIPFVTLHNISAGKGENKIPKGTNVMSCSEL